MNATKAMPSSTPVVFLDRVTCSRAGRELDRRAELYWHVAWTAANGESGHSKSRTHRLAKGDFIEPRGGDDLLVPPLSFDGAVTMLENRPHVLMHLTCFEQDGARDDGGAVAIATPGRDLAGELLESVDLRAQFPGAAARIPPELLVSGSRLALNFVKRLIERDDLVASWMVPISLGMTTRALTLNSQNRDNFGKSRIDIAFDLSFKPGPAGLRPGKEVALPAEAATT